MKFSNTKKPVPAFFNHLSTERKVVFALLFILPIFYLTIKSWTNFISLLLGLVTLYHISKNSRCYFLERGVYFWVFLFFISAPFLCEFVIKTVRGPFSTKALDGSSRFLLGSILFIYLSRCEDCIALVKAFMLGCTIAVAATFISVYFIRDFYWDGRAATYFVDPNSLPIFTGVLSCISLFFIDLCQLRGRYKHIAITLIILSLLYIIHLSQTRSAWIPGIILIIYFITQRTNAKKISLLASGTVLFIFILIFYKTNSVFDQRVDDMLFAFEQLCLGNLNTGSSVSIRIKIILAELALIQHNPLLGFPDGAIPSFETLKAISPTLDKNSYSILRSAGSHFELLAQIVRKGVILGLLTGLALFILPVFFLKDCLQSNNIENVKISRMSICAVLILFLSSFGIQVFNLKMYSTFWGIFLALTYSLAYNFHQKRVKNW